MFWKDINKKLPKKEGYYWVFLGKLAESGFLGFNIDYYYSNTKRFKGWAVTHWMPLPKAPYKYRKNKKVL